MSLPFSYMYERISALGMRDDVMYKFIEHNGKAFAFIDENIFRLGCYVKLFPEYVQVRNGEANIYHKHHNHTYYITKGDRLSYRLDLVPSKDVKQLLSLCQHIKGSK